MKLILFIPFIVFLSKNIQAQHSNFLLFVCDSNLNVIPFANIVFIHSDNGIMTNSNGIASINAKLKDTVIISSVGYEPKIYVLRKESDTIVLRQKINLLEDVTVIYSKYFKQRISIGYFYHKNKSSFSFKPGAQIAMFFQDNVVKNSW